MATICRGEARRNALGIFKNFKCATAESLTEDIAKFLNEYGMVLPQQTQTAGRWNVLLHMASLLNSQYSDHVKYLIFENADAHDDLLDILDEICSSELQDDMWKVVVTTTRTDIRPRKYPNIGRDNFVQLNGFSLADVEKMYDMECEDDIEEDDGELVRLLYGKLGILPLALRVAMKDLVLAMTSKVGLSTISSR